MPASRETVDLSQYPGLVVVYLGLKLRQPRGLLTLFKLGPAFRNAVAAGPEGLLRHEFMLFGPLHVGMRQYWRDLDSLEQFTRAMPHAGWWKDFTKDPGGTGFWHEAYQRHGGIEGIFLNLPERFGLRAIAPSGPPGTGSRTARDRLGSPAAPP